MITSAVDYIGLIARFQFSGLLYLRNFAASVPHLEYLCVECIIDGQDEGSLDVSGATFPQLKILRVDTSFDSLQLVACVAKRSPLLESLVFYDAPRESSHYGEGSDLEAATVLVEAVAHMKNVKNLVVNTELVATERMIHMLAGGGRDDGVLLSDQLQFLELRVETLEVVDEVLRRCLNLRHLALVFTREELVGGQFTGVCAIKDLVSVELRGECNCHYHERVTSTQFYGHSDIPPGLIRALAVNNAGLEVGWG